MELRFPRISARSALIIFICLLVILVVVVIIVFGLRRDNSPNIHDIFGPDSIIPVEELPQVQYQLDLTPTDFRDYRTYNPSVFVYQNELYRVYRMCNFTQCPGKRNPWKSHARHLTKSETIIERVKDGRIFRVKHPRLSSSKCEQGCEDARTFTDGDRLYLVCNTTTGSKCQRSLNLLELNARELLDNDNKLLETVRTNRLHFPEMADRDQKNWMPFLHEKKIHFVYSINPHTIVRYDVDGRCELVAETHNPRLPGNLRGGTQILRVQKWNLKSSGRTFSREPKYVAEDLYLGFIHTRDSNFEYSTYVYAFEVVPPFRVKYISSGFVFGTPGSHSKRIQFASGLTRVQRDGIDYLYVTYGENDCCSKVSMLREEDVLRSLKPV